MPSAVLYLDSRRRRIDGLGVHRRRRWIRRIGRIVYRRSVCVGPIGRRIVCGTVGVRIVAVAVTVRLAGVVTVGVAPVVRIGISIVSRPKEPRRKSKIIKVIEVESEAAESIAEEGAVEPVKASEASATEPTAEATAESTAETAEAATKSSAAPPAAESAISPAEAAAIPTTISASTESSAESATATEPSASAESAATKPAMKATATVKPTATMTSATLSECAGGYDQAQREKKEIGFAHHAPSFTKSLTRTRGQNKSHHPGWRPIRWQAWRRPGVNS